MGRTAKQRGQEFRVLNNNKMEGLKNTAVVNMLIINIS